MFAVFGKSYEAAKKKALKLTPTHTGTGASYLKSTKRSAPANCRLCCLMWGNL